MVIMDEKLLTLIKNAASEAPDPSRAQRNLERVAGAMEDTGLLVTHMAFASHLFACSQFLANHSAGRPSDLIWALEAMKKPVERQRVLEDSDGLLGAGELPEPEAMERLRVFKRRWLMVVTLRDLTKATDITGSMEELSWLAEAVIELALRFSTDSAIKRHGIPPGGGYEMSVIALGKLGGMEINYSSDVDLMFVYTDREGETGGAETPSGLIANRISVHEFYVKVAEGVSALLGRNTDEGIAYRVDLRLRPAGQKGEIAIPLSAYKRYYENWGRTWERMALIRSRPVAGDPDLGRAFLSVVEHFVWHRPADYQEVEEIRSLKKKIDSTFTRDDIKRGYGGIREAEFFVQTFQLIYGSENKALRSFRFMDAVKGLKRMGMVPAEELDRLVGAYLHFRRLEHYLQMLDDLQTYRIPSGETELGVLAEKMGFLTTKAFLSDLRIRRMGVKDMYNSLLGTEEDAHTEALSLLEDEFSDGELKGYMAFKGALDTDDALRSIKRLRELMSASRSPADRAVTRRGVPHLIDLALREPGPDKALKGLESFLSSFGLKEAYMNALMDEKGTLTRGLMRLMSMSSELTRIFLSSPSYLNWLVESMPIRKSLRWQRQELRRLLKRSGDQTARLIKYRSVEWVRTGMHFFQGIIDVGELTRSLSHLADAVTGAALELAGAEGTGLGIMALGKHGGRELTYGSDLDIIFVSHGTEEATGAAERALKLLTSYSGLTTLYEVDTRLRPDGSKGQLVKSLEGYRKYYTESAQPWEVQALLKTRPVAGDSAVGAAFMAMARQVLIERCHELTLPLLRETRERIVAELARKSGGLDIKLGPGGMEDVEFHVQWLQLSYLRDHPSLMVQNTQAALSRLMKAGILERQDGLTLSSLYDYYRKLKTYLRANGEKVVDNQQGAGVGLNEVLCSIKTPEMQKRLLVPVLIIIISMACTSAIHSSPVAPEASEKLSSLPWLK
jgi:glutamate-ammonia-ligase adenylyltransferase